MDDPSLPNGFEELEPWVRQWALKEPAARLAMRQHSAMETLEEFYRAVEPRLEEMLDDLDKREPRLLSPADERLYWLALSCAEVALSVEIYGAPKLPLAPGFDRFKISYFRMEPSPLD